MVDYEKEYDKYEDTPNNIDYGSWYEYDNFQDFLDGKNAMDLTEGEEIDYLHLNIPEDSIFDFNELRDDESIFREEYLNDLIESKFQEEEAFKEFLNSLNEDGIDYEYLESIFAIDDKSKINYEDFEVEGDDEIQEKMILERLIQEHLLKKGELDKDFLNHYSMENDIDMDDYYMQDPSLEFDYDDGIDERYYEQVELWDDLHYKSIESRKKSDEDEDSFNEITDYDDLLR